MAKIRVYEIAKEVNIDSKTLVAKLQAMGYDVKSHASAIDETEGHAVIERIKTETKANVVEKRVSTGIIRRRAKASEASPTSDVAGHLEEQPDVESVSEAPQLRVVESIPAEPEQVAAAPAGATGAVQLPQPVEPTPGEAAPEAVEPVEPSAEQKTVRHPREGGASFYRAQVIRRPTPVETTPVQAQVVSRPAAPTEAKPTGIRVLKVVPGKEGRGHEFIDMSKPEKGKRPKSARETRADLREQLFDVFSTEYVPGSRRKRMVRKAGRKTEVTTPKEIKRVIKMEGYQISSSELAKRMGVKLRDVNTKLQEMGEVIEDPKSERPIDLGTAELLAQEFGHEVQDTSFKEDTILQAASGQEVPTDRVHRPPVVTVMGHVDHGKTSILDAIRTSNVADGEEGGITQHIGAYEVRLPKGTISFIDTPGHEAFAAMRARGASVTDLVVLVVAADDGIMPQTIEAIHHAQAAKVPIVVAINKVDLPGAQPDRVRQALTEYALVSEQWGGDTQMVDVSAKTKQGLNELLDGLLLQAEMMELSGNPKKPATGSILEARLDKGRGPVATLLVKDGTLCRGDVLVVGTTFGRARMMFNFEGEPVDAVTPGRPVQVQGLSEVPQAGESFHVVPSEREAKKLVEHRLEDQKLQRSGQTAALSLEDFYERLAGSEKLELKVMIKADVQGSAEAVRQAVEKLSHPRVAIKVIHHGVGAITETDVNLASASKTLLIGFNVRPDTNAKKLAQTLGVDIRTYKIIYDLTEDVRQAQTGLLPSTVKENVIGRAEVRDLFNVPKIGTVAGVMVVDGKLQRGAFVRLLRDSVEVHQGKMSSLKRFKEDVREVANGFECGIGIENFNDIKRGDIIEAFIREEERPTL
jgi:translation initiation factor IF-2